jgi:hypothetical protein
MLSTALIFEGLFLLFAFGFAYFQVPVIKDMRDYVPINNPYVKSFHRRGFLIAFYVGALLSFGFMGVAVIHHLNILGAIPLAVSFISIYWLVFDITIGHFVHGDLFFIGNSAGTDIWLNKHFPHGDGGEVKAAACLTAIIGLNILFYFL